MTLGTITIQAESTKALRPQFMDVVSFAGDSSYPTGGTAFDALFQAKTKDQRNPIAVIAIDGGGYQVAYDRATGKLKLYQGDNDNSADAPGIEVPNATNLSAVTFVVLVISA